MTDWVAFPLAVARTAGYAYDLLDGLAEPDLPALALAPDDRFTAGYADACEAARRRLAAVLTDPAVREGIVVLAPDALRNTADRVIDRAGRQGGPDKHERKMALFVQRLAAKCDTNAIAGTIGYVALADELTRLLPRRPERRGFVAHWLLSDLVLRLATADGRFLRRQPHLGPAVALLPDRAGTALRALVEAAPDWATVMTNHPNRRLDEETVVALHRRGAVWSAPPLPVAEPDALRSAAIATAALHRHELATSGTQAGTNQNKPDTADGQPDLDGLRAAAEEYAAGGADRKVEVLARTERWLTSAGARQLRRGGGQVYADRTVLSAEHYEPVADPPPDLGTAVVAQLRCVLDLAVATCAWGREQARRLAAADLSRIAAGRPTVPLAEVLRDLPTGYPVDLNAAPPATALLDLIATAPNLATTSPDLIATAPDLATTAPDLIATAPERAVRLEAGDVDAACASWLTACDLPLLASPDVFVDAADDAAGAPRIVVGEVHPGLTVFGNLLCFLDDREAVVDRVRGWLAERDPRTRQLVNVAVGHRFGKVCHLEVMPRTLELTGARAAGRVRLGVDDLEVDRGLAVRVRATGEAVALMLTSSDGSEFSPFAPPAARLPVLRLPGARHMPRVLVGEVVLQRATWWFPLPELGRLGVGDPARRYRALVAFADRNGLPRRTFVRVPGEPKPIHLDLASPLLVDAVVRLLARAAPSAGAEVRVTEMLPVPRPGGRIREFRLSCIRSNHGSTR